MAAAEPLVKRPRPGAALGVDLGTRRIGISLSDTARVLARPHAVIDRSGDDAADREAIAALVEESGATVVVVGLPLSLSGRDGPAATRARVEIAALAGRLEVPVYALDERLTTVQATRRLAEAQRESAGRRRAGRRVAVRRIVDDLAATVILQSWLDAGAHR